MVRVGITGQNGFMGSHLYNYLGLVDDIIRVDFEKEYFEKEELLDVFVNNCDVIVHLAAMNRHQNEQIIYNTNLQLVSKLTEACERCNRTPKIIFSSSIQEERDNLYGKSKKEGKLKLEKWAKLNNASVSTLIIPNVYGPFGRPFYNSVISTFCHQVIHNETPKIDVDGDLNLIYINELSEIIYKEIIKTEKQITSYKVKHTAEKKVSEILQFMNSFKLNYFDKGIVPNLSNSFSLNLFNTFRSFFPTDYFPKKFTLHTDERGSFVEIIRANTSGQSSYSTTKSEITRGNHYHTRKVERFAVISGKALIQLRKINTNTIINYYLDGNEPSYVDMPVWYTHSIKNIGDTELITLFWINEPYNPDDPDTYFENVEL